MLGAALLAGHAALKLGSGRVYLGLLDPDAPSVDFCHPEIMIRRADALLQTDLQALACGPGLGRSGEAIRLLDQALKCPLPVVLDADALNILATDGRLEGNLYNRVAPVILTPHPAEAARLLGCSTREVQSNRVRAARELAERYRCDIALKGCGTVVATVDGEWWINSTGNPGMASGGMGDVLTGLIVALLAQGWPAAAALLAGVHLHGAAADRLVAAGCGPVGLTAGEVIDAARRLFNEWVDTGKAC
jgi:ADP-dependent NAD(P)H-hydrate dehydratase / NAD(P)H-hydrate epimerase